jgi:hypothetical protein
MRRLITFLFLMSAAVSFGQLPQDTIPQSQSQPFFDRKDARHFTSWDQLDTLSTYLPGDTAHIVANDSIYIHKLMGYHVAAGSYGDTIEYGFINSDSIWVGSSSFRVYDNPGYEGTLKDVTVPRDTFALADSSIQYIGGFWNNGNPEMRWLQDRDGLNVSDGVPLLTIFKQDGTKYLQNWLIGDGLVERLFKKDIFLDRFERQNGLIIDTLNSLNVQISSGTIWQGGRQFDLGYFSSVTDSLYWYWYDGTRWDYDGVTEIPNQYYNPSTGLEELQNNNRYVSVWLFRATTLTDNNPPAAFIVLDDQEYKSATNAASDAFLPEKLPSIVKRFSKLVGRFIINKNATEVTAIESAFGDVTVSFTGGGVTDHGNLTGLDDPSDHTWALEWSDTTDQIATKYDVDTATNLNLQDVTVNGNQTDQSLRLYGRNNRFSSGGGLELYHFSTGSFIKSYADKATSDYTDLYIKSGYLFVQPESEIWLEGPTEINGPLSQTTTDASYFTGQLGVGMSDAPGASSPTLEVDGPLKIGNTTSNFDGFIRWTGSDLEVFKDGSWTSLTTGGGVTDHGNLTGLDDPSDHTWALEWSDTTDRIATKYDVDTVAFQNSDETDPVYSGDPASSITASNSGEVITTTERNNLTDAYNERGSQIAGANLNWDGAELDVTGVVTDESDPVYTGDPASGITTTDINQWDEAYSERGSVIAGNLLSWDGTELDVNDDLSLYDNTTSGFYNSDGDISKTAITQYSYTYSDLSLNIDDTPVNGQTAEPISSNWAYDHGNNTANPHSTGLSNLNDYTTNSALTVNNDLTGTTIYEGSDRVATRVWSTLQNVTSQGNTTTLPITAAGLNSTADIQADGNLQVDGTGDSYVKGDFRIGSSDPSLTFGVSDGGFPTFKYDETFGFLVNSQTNEDFRISEGGNTPYVTFSGVDKSVGIGTTSPSEALDVDGNILASGTINGSNINASNWDAAYSHSTTTTGNPHGIGLSDVSANDNSTADDLYANDFILNSDRRLKKNIKDFTRPLAALDLNPVQFKWRESEKFDAGFVAQELLAKFPYLVKERPDGYLGISYAKITALNNATIQELWERVESQQDTIRAQQKRINKLSNKVNRMEVWLKENTSY